MRCFHRIEQFNSIILGLGLISFLFIVKTTNPPVQFARADFTLGVVLPSSAPTYSTRLNSVERQRGLEAAILEVNEKGGINGVNVSLIVKDDGFDRSFDGNVAQLEALAAENITLSIGLSIVADAALGVGLVPAFDDIPVFGPWSVWDDHFTKNSRRHVHWRVPFNSEMNAMMHYGISSELRCKRFVLGYSNFGPIPDIARAANETLVRLGLPEARIVELPDTDQPNHAIQEEILINETFREPKAQCVVFWNGESLFSAMEAIARHPDYDKDNMFFFGPSIIGFQNMSLFANPEVMDHLYVNNQVPEPSQTDYFAVRSYHSAIEKLEASGLSGVNETYPWVKTSLALEYYLLARLAIESIRRSGITETTPLAEQRSRILDAVYGTKMFGIDDIVLGPFSDGCVGKQTSATGACWCNSGIKHFWTARVNKSTGEFFQVEDDPSTLQSGVASIEIDSKECVFTDSGFLPPHLFVVLGAENDTSTTAPLQSRLAAHFRSTLLSSYAAASTQHRLEVVETTRSSNFTSVDAEALLHRYQVHSVVFPSVGSRTLGELPPESLITIAPLYDNGRYWDNDKTIPATLLDPSRARGSSDWTGSFVPFFPTMADLIDTTVDHLVAEGRSTIHIIYEEGKHEYLASTIQSMHSRLKQAVSAYELPLGSTQATIYENVLDKVRNDGTTTVLFATQNVDQLQAALQYLWANVAQRIHFAFVGSEFILHEALQSELARDAARFKSGVTSLSHHHVTYASGLSTFAPPAGSSHHQKAHTDPADVYGALVAQFLLATLARSERIFQTPDFVDALYSSGTAGSDFGTVGPFSRTSCSTPGAPQATCECSKGIQKFYMRSLVAWASVLGNVSGVFDKAHDDQPVHSFTLPQCGVVYTPLPPEPGVPINAVIGLLVAIVVFLVLTVLIVKLCFREEKMPFRELIVSPVWFTAGRIILGFLDMLTDGLSCYIVIERSFNLAFTILFGILTGLAMIANLFEMRNLFMYFWALLSESEEDEVELAKSRYAWARKLALGSALTLLFEDIPMVTMTTIALYDEVSVFLFASLIISSILLGSKVIYLKEIVIKAIREHWNEKDALDNSTSLIPSKSNLSELAPSGKENAETVDSTLAAPNSTSIKKSFKKAGMAALAVSGGGVVASVSHAEIMNSLSRDSPQEERSAFAQLMKDRNPRRYRELKRVAQQLDFTLQDYGVKPSEYWGVVSDRIAALVDGGNALLEWGSMMAPEGTVVSFQKVLGSRQLDEDIVMVSSVRSQTPQQGHLDVMPAVASSGSGNRNPLQLLPRGSKRAMQLSVNSSNEINSSTNSSSAKMINVVTLEAQNEELDQTDEDLARLSPASLCSGQANGDSPQQAPLTD